MGQQPVKALTERSKSGKTIKASGKSKEAEKSEFHTATGKIEIDLKISFNSESDVFGI